jgi:hypothetical protein
VDSRQGGGASVEGDANVCNFHPLVAQHSNEVKGFSRTNQPPAIPSVLSVLNQNQPQTSTSQPNSKIDSSSNLQSSSSQQQQPANDFDGNAALDMSDDPAPDIEDPFAGMSDKDRFGLKGLLSTLKGPYVDQAALITGIDINALGFDLNSTECVLSFSLSY